MPLVHVCWPIGLTDVGTARGDAAKIPSATRNRVHAAAFGACVQSSQPDMAIGLVVVRLAMLGDTAVELLRYSEMAMSLRDHMHATFSACNWPCA